MPIDVRLQVVTMLLTTIVSLNTNQALSHPLDEHPVHNYFDTFNAKACSGQLGDPELKPDMSVCQQLADKCANPGADNTHPSCVIMTDWTRPPQL